jgi:hypothetical protein
MAKSLRSKTKRAYRHKKREDSTYAASDAARLARINAKLSASASLPIDAQDDEVAEDGDAKMVEGGSEVQAEGMCCIRNVLLVHLLSVLPVSVFYACVIHTHTLFLPFKLDVTD